MGKHSVVNNIVKAATSTVKDVANTTVHNATHLSDWTHLNSPYNPFLNNPLVGAAIGAPGVGWIGPMKNLLYGKGGGGGGEDPIVSAGSAQPNQGQVTQGALQNVVGQERTMGMSRTYFGGYNQGIGSLLDDTRGPVRASRILLGGG